MNNENQKKSKDEKLPPGWNWFKLEDIVEKISTGISKKQNKEEIGQPVTRIETISDGIINFKRVGFVDGLSQDDIKKYKLPAKASSVRLSCHVIPSSENHAWLLPTATIRVPATATLSISAEPQSTQEANTVSSAIRVHDRPSEDTHTAGAQSPETSSPSSPGGNDMLQVLPTATTPVP